MDTNRITGPISDHMPSTGAVASLAASLADTTSGLAGQIGDQAAQIADHLGDIDVSRTVRRGRRLVAQVVPGMSPPRTRFSSRQWWMLALAIAGVIAMTVVLRRRSGGDARGDAVAGRDDWSTNTSTNNSTKASTNDSTSSEPGNRSGADHGVTTGA